MRGKIYFLVSIFAFSVVSVFASDYSFQRHPIVNSRSSGMGGMYVTDTSSFYTLFSNPAALALTKKQILWPGLAFNLGGPLSDLYTMIGDLSGGDDKLMIALGKLLEKHNSVTLNTAITGPFTFGSVQNGFAWGIFNNTYLSADISSLNYSNIRAGEELTLQFGYGFSLLKTKLHVLSLGVSAKAIIQSEFAYEGKLLSIKELFDDLEKIPFYVNAGFGFDAGVFYQFADSLKFGAVFHDIYTPIFVNRLDKYSSQKGYHVIPCDLTLGIGFKLPESWTGKIVSSWMVMADYKNILNAFAPFARNPWLNFSVGTELQLFKFLSLRVGISEMYLHAGAGLSLGVFKLDVSVYGKERGSEPGSKPQLNWDVSFAFLY